MPLYLIALLLTAPSVDGPTLPLATFEPMSGYLTCLYQPLEGVSVPDGRPAREEMVQRILRDCQATRETVADETKAMLANEAPATDPAAVDALLLAWERQLRFIIVEREQAEAASRAYEECLEHRVQSEC